MSVLVTGANGFVGSTLVRALMQKGFGVRGAVRHLNSPDFQAGVEWVAMGDVDPHTDWSFALCGVETVVHLVARTHRIQERRHDVLEGYRRVNVGVTRRLAQQAAKAGVHRFVFVSSVKVNGERTFGRAFHASDVPRPEDAYGISKREAEEALAAVAAGSCMETLVVRPPLIYGPGVKGNFPRLMGLVAKGFPLPFGSVKNRRSMVALANVVDLLLRCVDAPQACDGTFLVSDGEPLSTPGLIRKIAAAMGKAPHLLPIPMSALALMGRLVGRGEELERLCNSLEVDDSDTRRLLGWQPPVSADDAIRATVRDFIQNRRLPNSPA